MTPATKPSWIYPGNVYDELEFPCVVDADGCVICSVCDDGIDEDQQDANARLIAAAHDLLEAVQVMHHAHFEYEGDDKGDWIRAAAELLAPALAKAVQS